MNRHLSAALDQIGIPAESKAHLVTNRIVDYPSLRARRTELEDERLDHVHPKDQKIIATVLVYLESLNMTGDPLPHFDAAEWMDFCIRHSRTRNPEKLDTREIVSDASMEIDKDADEDDDDDHVGRLPGSRRKSKDDDKKDTPKVQGLEKPEKEVALPDFEMMDQSFGTNVDTPPASDHDDTPKPPKAAGLSYVDFEDRRYSKRQCYKYKTHKGGTITIGIRSFRSKTEANCVVVVHGRETFLAKGDQADKFESVVKDKLGNPGFYFQLPKQYVVHLSELGPACTSPQPEYLPDWIYEPRTSGNRQSFAYTYDRQQSPSNLVQLRRKEIRLLEAFAGAGGMHLGYKEEGFTTAMAVELNEAAVETFRCNNGGSSAPIWRGDVNDFTRRMETDPDYRKSTGRIDAIHVSSPCQGFSTANRGGCEDDGVNNQLSYTFVDWLRVSGALVGCFENVEGMWSEKGMPYLLKLLVDTMALGYQVRLQVLRGQFASDTADALFLLLI